MTAMETLRIYLPAVVLTVWSLGAAAGYTGDVVTLVFVSAFTITVCVSAEELRARYVNYFRQGRHDRRHYP